MGRACDGNYLRTGAARTPAGRDDYPGAWVSWHAAAAYAKWAQRLPTEAEWGSLMPGSKTAYRGARRSMPVVARSRRLGA